jgi:phospholipid/cholesterol/gamma-HCH transport system permease protein
MAQASPIEKVGRNVADSVADLGSFAIFSAQTVRWVVTDFTRWRLLRPQLYEVGVRSLPVIIITGAFIGMVLAAQIWYQFESIGRGAWSGSVINISVLKELGPVLAATMLAGRVGGALAAELGTMKVTEQIDALRAMGISPMRYLVAPRVLAAILMLPVLTIYADAIAIFGGYAVAVTTLSVPSAIYLQGLREFFQMKDLLSGLVKAVFFGNIIGMMGCYHGFQTEGGAEGVGRATTMAVVSSCVLILVLDYILATVLFRIVFA